MSCEQDRIKLKSVTAVLNKIYADYVNVDQDDLQKTAKIVIQVFKKILKAMCKEDPFFSGLCPRLSMGGSVGDSLKIHIPDEYDLNVVLKMPPCFTTFPANIPGHIHLKRCDHVTGASLPSFLKSDEEYLLPQQLLSWTQSLLTKALNTFPHDNTSYEIKTSNGRLQVIRISRIKPGFTLTLKLHEEEVDVDFVPCFEFPCSNLPENYRKRILEGTCLILAKETAREIPCKERYWRLSFRDFERKMLFNRCWLKPAIKLIKAIKVNEEMDGSMCSYHIKAIAVNALLEAENEFWKSTLSNCFLHLLQYCIRCFQNKKVPILYNKNDNLLEHVNDSTCLNVASRFQRIYENIVRDVDPRIVAIYLLDEEELLEFEEDFNVSKKWRERALRHHEVDLTKPVNRSFIC